MDQQKRSYTILATAQAALGAILALVIFALYGLRPSLLSDPNASLIVASFGAMAVLYYFGIHWWLAKQHLALSSLIITTITAVNLILVIASTGGLNSPYYAFWLLIIVAAGTFGTLDTLIILLLTASYYLFALWQHGFGSQYTITHLPQLGLSLLAGGLSEAIQRRARFFGGQTTTVINLEGQLSQEQLKAQVIMDAIAEGVVVVDSQRRIQLFNPAAQTITGWDEASAQNIDYETVLNLKTTQNQALNQQTDPLVKAWGSGHSFASNDLVMTTRAGTKLPIYISISPVFDTQPKINGAIILFRDISKEKEIARQKDEFISTASHELRTPVAAIEGYVSLALNPNVATIDERAKGYLNKAHSAIGHLGDLFRDLLSITRAEEGRLQGPLVPVDLTELVQTAIEDMKFTAKEKNLVLSFQTADGTTKTLNPTFWVMANPERLREVVMNLIDNAFKYTAHGSVTATLGSAEADKDVTLTISDTGIGIPAEDVSHLFQKFYRIDNSATRTINGTGLGLYLARTLIELYNGRIWVESTLGKGSTFFINLPRITAEEAESYKSTAGNIVRPKAEEAAVPVATPTPQPVIIMPTPAESTAPTQAGQLASKL